jgi:hypothetical protein
MQRSDDPATIQIAGQTVTSRVVSHIQAASKDTGVSFSYLMAQAGKESGFASEAGSRASSAAGLFQFTKGTWLQLVKTHGATHGLGDLAQHITRTRAGDFVVADAKTRQQILDLRRDPQLSSLMAGEYARDNKSYLERTLGRPVDSTDLYLAHFLGPGGAGKVLKAKATDPAQSAVELLPQAARKNPTVFYSGDHSPRSVTAVYDRIRHAIERPMHQYAQLEGGSAPHADGAAPSHPSVRHGAARAAADPVWPFETGNWQQSYVPAESPTPAAELPQQVALTTGAQSADQISQPIPPLTVAPSTPQGRMPIGKWLKNLLG